MALPVFRFSSPSPLDADTLKINPELVERYLIYFLRDEVIRQRKMSRVVLGLSGGLDSAVVAYLAALAFGPENVTAFMMPYKISSPTSLADALLVVQHLGIESKVIDITQMVDGYASTYEIGLSPTRLGNICSRCRTVILFDQSMEVGGIPLGTGNKSERLLGYFTWHGDDAPPVNPLGDLFKTQVYELAKHLGVPNQIIEKPPSADLIQGQTDEGDYGIGYDEIDVILHALVQGYTKQHLLELGLDETKFDLVNRRLRGTHWKRRPATVAMLSDSAVGEYYLRPVDYR
ncbi:MAG: NAD+ synthase [Chthonomonas sp.]|nr:NAD+ synthase [Chthonomonas sp.]